MVKTFFYQTSATHWSSIPKGKIYGKRKTVTIKNGKGMQIEENLNMTGETVSRRHTTLRKKNIKNLRNKSRG